MNSDFLKNIDLSSKNILKFAGFALAGVVLLALVIAFFKTSFDTFTRGGWGDGIAGMPAMMVEPAYYGGVAYDSVGSSYYEESDMMQGLSSRNVSSIYPPSPGNTVGGDAEEYEVTEYSATVETRDLEGTCSAVEELKAFDYVVFESANMYDRGCNYSFKVEHAHVEEVLAAIEALDPKDLSESIFTIKRQIDDFTSEQDILTRKLASIDETLRSATKAYDDLTVLATRAQNVESLAKIIDSRLSLIERLTQERVNINAQLERLARAKEQQLDRLVYTYFNVSVYENKFVDGENIKDSWKQAVREFVMNTNKVIQDITVNLIGLLFLILQFAIYALIVLVVAKYGWKVAKYIWQK
ncbi:hypothetical protein C4556_03475 [Candidatus Parcubacteria bacterium]|nr:MAG: hypothetical protein C4556_03475 [Candidatus Parcubacteria bacterium]